MPEIIKTYKLEISVEQFLNACSRNELLEIDVLLASNHFIRKMQEPLEPKVNQLK